MKRLLLSVPVMALLLSCAKNTERIEIVAFEEPADANGWTELIQDIQIVPLEDDGRHFAWNADLVRLKDGYLVVDKCNCQIARYGDDGRFVCQIGEQGNGPGEYLDISNIQLVDDNVLVFSSPGATLHRFDLAGQFLGKEMQEDLGGMQFVQVPEGILCFNGYGMPDQCKASLWSKGKMQKFFPYDAQVVAFGDINPSFTFDGDRVFVRDQLDNTVYCYHAGQMDPRIRFDFGKYGIEDSFYKLDYMASATYLMEKDICMVSRYMESGDDKLVEVIRPLERLSYYGLCQNGRWHWACMGIEEKDPFSSSIKMMDGNRLYCLVTPALLKRMDASWRQKISNPDALDNCSEDDNDAVVIIQL